MNLFDVYFNPQGTLTRRYFWYAIIYQFMFMSLVYAFVGTLAFVLQQLGVFSQSLGSDDGYALVTLVLLAILYFPTNLMFFTVVVKRYHDRGKSGWWSLIMFIPVIGFFWTYIELGFFKGITNHNQ